MRFSCKTTLKSCKEVFSLRGAFFLLSKLLYSLPIGGPMKKAPKFLLYTSLFLCLGAGIRTLTGDFAENYLIQPSGQDSSWATPKDESIRPILEQKYTYLGRGMQAYVFLAEDGEHVLKLFKPLFPAFSYSLFGKNFKLGLSKVPFAREFFTLLSPNSGKAQQNKDFQSYFNAFSLVQEETQLRYLHLAKTDYLNHKLELYDKIGVKHLLDLDSTCFLIQKKADLFYPTLSSLVQKGQIEEAKELIDSFVKLSFRFIKQGIVNPTTLKKNFGSIGHKAVQIDVGRIFTKENLGLNEAPTTSQIAHSTSTLKKWLSEEAPALSDYLEVSIAKEKETYD